MARKTTGYNDKGHQIFAVIGYYPTQKEALLALANYNYSPYDLNRTKTTLREVFEEWEATTLPSLGKSMQGSMRSAWKHCKAIEDMPYRNLRKTHMQSCIDSCGKSQSTQANIKLLFSKLDAFAYDLDIISKQYSQSLTTEQTAPVRESVPFTDAEVRLMIESGEEEVIFLLYTGLRIGEAASLTADSIDGDLIQCGEKTAAGKNRIIPIHPDIMPMVTRRMKQPFLFAGGKKQNYYRDFMRIMKKHGLEHHPHDCRHTFRSQLDRNEANKVCINLIVGHKSKEVGERVYTHKTVEELRETILLLKYK